MYTLILFRMPHKYASSGDINSLYFSNKNHLYLLLIVIWAIFRKNVYFDQYLNEQSALVILIDTDTKGIM